MKMLIDYLQKEFEDVCRFYPKNIRLQTFKKRMLDMAIIYHNKQENYINHLHEEAILQSNDYIRLRMQCTALEAVLLIHGVNDYPAWMEKDPKYLIHTAVELQSKNMVRTPNLLIGYVNKS